MPAVGWHRSQPFRVAITVLLLSDSLALTLSSFLHGAAACRWTLYQLTCMLGAAWACIPSIVILFHIHRWCMKQFNLRVIWYVFLSLPSPPILFSSTFSILIQKGNKIKSKRWNETSLIHLYNLKSLSPLSPEQPFADRNWIYSIKYSKSNSTSISPAWLFPPSKKGRWRTFCTPY